MALLFPVSVSAQCADLRINEIDYDQDGTDTAEFIEIKALPGTPLAGLDLHLINGLTAAIYHTEPLTGTIPANGYLVVGSLIVAEVDIVLGAGGANLIQNDAPDAVGLWDREGSMYCDFINYEGTVSGFEGWPDIGTDSSTNCATGASTSLALREASLPEGEWVPEACATPGAANESPTALALTALTARVADQPVFSLNMLTALISTTVAISSIIFRQAGKKCVHSNDLLDRGQ
jgi:hypothetical protein